MTRTLNLKLILRSTILALALFGGAAGAYSATHHTANSIVIADGSGGAENLDAG